jgi:hypothetical protein
MDEVVVDKKYTDFIENLIEQISPLLPQDVNELQKSYLITNIRKSAMLMASAIPDNVEFSKLDFEKQCFYIQILAEWSFHKEIDLFRSGIPPRYWKGVMQKIWYAMWEVMYACIKNDAPDSVVLSLVERLVNRTYNDAVDELKAYEVIDETIEEQAKEQSNIKKMAEEIREVSRIQEKIKETIKRILLAIIIGAIVSFAIIKFKTIGLATILTILLVYHFMPSKKEE